MFGPDAAVYVFGSRANDAERGGDIDLLVEAGRPVSNRVMTACRFSAQLQLQLGDQKIDTIVVDPDTPPQRIFIVAKQTGVRL